jgi:hypothetical protein
MQPLAGCRPERLEPVRTNLLLMVKRLSVRRDLDF